MKISNAISFVNENAIKNVEDALNSAILGQGKYIEEFEEKTAKLAHTKYAIACASGTLADLVALLALKEAYYGKHEVLVPALTFVAQVNTVILAGLTPVFVDADHTLQMNPMEAAKKITDNTLAIMPAHLLGRQADMKEFKILEKTSDIFLLEDACEAFAITPIGIGGTYSFFPSHTITTGEGGMIVTNDEDFANLCRAIRNHGREQYDVLNKFHFDIFGLNAKMCNLVAAVGAGIVDEAPRIIKERQQVVQWYNERLQKDWYAESPFGYPYECASEEVRDRTILMLDGEGVDCRKLFSCLPVKERIYQHYGHQIGDFPVAEDIGRRWLYLPCHQGISSEQVDYIAEIIEKNPA